MRPGVSTRPHCRRPAKWVRGREALTSRGGSAPRTGERRSAVRSRTTGWIRGHHARHLVRRVWRGVAGQSPVIGNPPSRCAALAGREAPGRTQRGGPWRVGRAVRGAVGAVRRAAAGSAGRRWPAAGRGSGCEALHRTGDGDGRREDGPEGNGGEVGVADRVRAALADAVERPKGDGGRVRRRRRRPGQGSRRSRGEGERARLSPPGPGGRAPALTPRPSRRSRRRRRPSLRGRCRRP